MSATGALCGQLDVSSTVCSAVMARVLYCSRQGAVLLKAGCCIAQGRVLYWSMQGAVLVKAGCCIGQGRVLYWSMDSSFLVIS